jgi:hypothetical protein
MNLHPGLIVRVNGKAAAAISSEGLNIISVRIQGDVLSPEIATLNATGGYYGAPEETQHLLWIVDHVLSVEDDIQVEFQESVANSHAGKTIGEVYPELSRLECGEPEDIGELAKHLKTQPPKRSGFRLQVSTTGMERQLIEVRAPQYSFFVSFMWQWTNANSAKFNVSSSTIQDIAEQKAGTNHLRKRLQYGQSVSVRVGT